MAGMEDKTGGAGEDTSEDDTGFSQNLALWKPCLLVIITSPTICWEHISDEMYHMSILNPVSILRHFIYEIFILEFNAGYLQHMAYDRTLNGYSAIKYKQCYNFELLTIGNYKWSW